MCEIISAEDAYNQTKLINIPKIDPDEEYNKILATVKTDIINAINDAISKGMFSVTIPCEINVKLIHFMSPVSIIV